MTLVSGKGTSFSKKYWQSASESGAGIQPNMHILNNLVNTFFFPMVKAYNAYKQTIRHAVLVSIKFKSNKPE